MAAGIGITRCRAEEPSKELIKARIAADWMSQDSGTDASHCFKAGHGNRLETKMLTAVLSEVDSPSLKAAFGTLAEANTPGADPQWRALYLKACDARRATRLKSLLAKTQQIIFTKHFNMGGSHYAYTEGLSDAQHERHFKPGSALCLLTMNGSYGTVVNLIESEAGVIRDPDISYDGKRLLFAWKKSERQDDYHLYEMELATRKVRQLTFGLGFADYEGCYLPNGDIIFNSTRCVSTVDCWWTEVSNLYTCDKDGKYLRRLGFDQVHSNYPQVLANGKVIYTRWDYNDRGQLYPQPLFQMNYDGTGQTEYYGNNSWWPTTVAHARGIPGSDKIIALASGHHSRQIGALIRIDIKEGRQEQSGATLVAPLVEDKQDKRYRRVDGYTGFNGHFQYPYPLNEKEYLASYSAQETGNVRNGYDLVYVREDGAREVLMHDPKLSCNQPLLLMPRTVPHLRPSTVDYRKTTGTYFVQDVYLGPGLKGIPRGTIKKLRVVALDFRAAGIGSNSSDGPAGGALVSTPISIRNGAWDVKTVLGEATVYEDGSACFEVPARTPMYFQCIDTNGYVVQTMRSWSTLMPGETLSCIGCHEDKDAAPPTGRAAALAVKAGVQKLMPFGGPAQGFSFPKRIQPILDKHCIGCHNDRTRKRGVDAHAKPAPAQELPLVKPAAKEYHAFSLLGATGAVSGGRNWSDAYLALTLGGKPNEIVQWLNVQSIPPMLPPYFAGSAKSKLPKMLKAGHKKVKLSQAELDMISCWIDLLVPYCGDYYEANAWSEKDRRKYDRYADKRKQMEALEKENIAAFIKARRGFLTSD
jgi:hypothetical protein